MDEFVYIPIDVAKIPKSGEVYVNEYFFVHNECIMFLKTSTCLDNMCLMRYINYEEAYESHKNFRIHNDIEIRQLDAIYIRSCSKYYAIEQKLKGDSNAN